MTQPITLVNGKPMTETYMTFQEFLAQFPNHDDAIDFVFACNKQGRVEVSRNTLPHYEYNEQAQRFIAYSDYVPNIHSFGVRIIGWYEDDDCRSDAIVKFPYSDTNAWLFFFRHFESELDEVTEESEMYWQDNFETNRLREAQALTLQIQVYQRQSDKMRRYIIENGETMSRHTFDANCESIAENKALEKRAKERIAELGF